MRSCTRKTFIAGASAFAAGVAVKTSDGDEGWCDPVGGPRYAKNVSCVFAKAELPKAVSSFRVRPVGFFGAKGRAIESGG